jgi:alpha-galactosidase
MSITVSAGPLVLDLRGDLQGWTASLSTSSPETGIHLVELRINRAEAAAPPTLALHWSFPCIDLHAQWRGDSSGSVGHFPPDWSNASVQGRACSQAPVICLYSAGGANRLTVAVEDAAHLSRLVAGVREENGTMACRAELFAGALPPGTAFRACLRFDLRTLPWHAALDAVAAWWEHAYPPVAVPDAGRQPMYSTWYSLHQAVDADAVERQCALARDLGCSAVIIDDGWQTMDGNRGYAYCGDWAPDRIPDMAGLVRRLHAQDMRVLLWYSVPFIGFKAAAHARFAGKYLRDDERLQTSVLDPRYPEVRDFLIGLYATAQRDWDLDGFKLDFVDSFWLDDTADATPKQGMDIADLDDAVVRLLGDVMATLRRQKPDILIEFRQSYIGPVMRTFGHLFRAGDCPADALGNRQRILDIRALCRATAAHADMIMWHADEPVESAALQLLNILFAVPQVSVLLDRIPEDHRAMLRFWLGWWSAHRACLLDGALAPEHPEARYTQATARTTSERITCLYQQVAARLGADEPSTIQLINATREDGVLVELDAPWQGHMEIRDTCGRIRQSQTTRLGAGLHRLAVPAAGLACLTRASA